MLMSTVQNQVELMNMLKNQKLDCGAAADGHTTVDCGIDAEADCMDQHVQITIW